MVCPACLTEEGGKRSVLVEIQRSDTVCGGEANGFKGSATTRDGETMLVTYPGRGCKPEPPKFPLADQARR
jgi:hypothetical protein